MKISLNWLKEHLPACPGADETAAKLGRLGVEVAALTARGAGFKGVVSAEVLDVQKHPNADKLRLCTLTDGEKKYSVVCGAPNVATGQKVPLARIGAVLPGGRAITRAKIRGVESEGMICSGAELGLSDEHNGILVMDPQTRSGVDVSGLLASEDTILDLEITPNRPDLLSHLGVARELSAALGLALKAPALGAISEAVTTPWTIDLAEPAACPRYVGRLFEGVKVGPSPGWLAQRLEAVGLRPVNNVVDVTNFMLMDMGQPMHAFDADKLLGSTVRTRWAKAGEKLKALDGKEYALNPEILVIADAESPCAIAGVMGGEASSVTEKTTRVFLESAAFAPAVVRRAGQALRLRSDSSYRFERGCDPEAAPLASARAAELLLKLGGPNAKASHHWDAYPKPERTTAITVKTEQVNAILGTELTTNEMRVILEPIAKELKGEGDAFAFYRPSWRRDLETTWDIAEETARLIGYDRIPSRAPAAPPAAAAAPVLQAAADSARRRLAACGLYEACTYDFVSLKQLADSRLPEGPMLANPLNEDWTHLRPSLLVGLLQSALGNANAGAETVRLFELGRVYRRGPEGVVDVPALGGLILGHARPASWREPKPPQADLYFLKGVVEELFEGAARPAWVPRRQPWLLASAAAALEVDGTSAGWAGMLHPAVARAWGLESHGVAVFELELEALARRGPRAARFKAFSHFPSSRRDLCVVVPREHAYAALESAVRGLRLPELAELSLIDVYEGASVGEGRRSITFHLTFRRDDRTLRDEEVAALIERILGELEKRFEAKLRS